LFLFKRNYLSDYDQIFKIKCDFNPKAHRDDRQHSKFIGLNQDKEVLIYFIFILINLFLKEKEKICPSRSSSEYGRRHNQHFHFNDRSHLKIDHVKKDFYRNNGFNT
jgi:hypothetical protein